MRLLSSIVLFLVWNLAFSQDLYLGIKAGYNSSIFTGNNTSHFQRKNDFHTGITAELNFSDLFAFQVEGLYNRIGAKDAKTNYPVSYVSLPFFGKIYPTEFFSIHLGGQYSYLLDDTYISAISNEENSLELGKNDFSFLLGLEYRIKKDFFVQTRYLIGVTEIDKFEDWKNSLFQVSVGYKFL